jgi:hypothetical protein
LLLRFRELLDLAENLGDCLCHVLNLHGRKELRKRRGRNGCRTKIFRSSVGRRSSAALPKT